MASPSFSPQSVVILGLGAEAASAAMYFQGGAQLAFFDDDPAKLAKHGAAGDASLTTLDALEAHAAQRRGEELWLRAPGMRPDHPALAIAARHQRDVTTFTGFWIARHRAHVRATITGTKGKSSVTALTGAILNAAGIAVRVGGNIGVTPNAPPANESWVFETSSDQLHDCPVAAPVHAFTSLHPEHLDWHGDMARYAAAKLRPYLLDPHCHAIIPENLAPHLADLPNPITRAEDALTWRADRLMLKSACGAEIDVALSSAAVQRLQSDPILLHTLRMAGTTALICSGLAPDRIAAGIASAFETWQGLPLRQEVIGEYGGRLWVNDALATIPQAVIAALRRFEGRTVRLILGGKERHQDFAPLSAYLNAHPNVWVYLYADAADRLDAQLTRKAHRAADFQGVLDAAYGESAPADVMLFSPAGATPEPGGNFQTRADWFQRFALSKVAP